MTGPLGLLALCLSCFVLGLLFPWFNQRGAARKARLHALEQARQCAIYPPTDTYHPEKRAAYDDVFKRISLLIERAG